MRPIMLQKEMNMCYQNEELDTYKNIDDEREAVQMKPSDVPNRDQTTNTAIGRAVDAR